MIVINGKIKSVLNDEYVSNVIIEIPRYQAERFTEIEKDKDHKIEIKEIKSKKTLQQNNKIWALITDIAKTQDIIPNVDRIYLQLLEMAKIKTIYIETIEEAKKTLQQGFRVVIERDKRTSAKGVETVVYECGWGLSKFNTEEASRFIDCLLEYANQCGVDVDNSYEWQYETT